MRRLSRNKAHKLVSKATEGNPLYMLCYAAGHHDASVALMKVGRSNNPDLLYADHCERWSSVKGDPKLNAGAVRHALGKVPSGSRVMIVAHQQWWRVGGWKNIERWAAASKMHSESQDTLKSVLRVTNVKVVGEVAVEHHESHSWAAYGTFAAAGTESYRRVLVLSVDAVGEKTTATARLFSNPLGCPVSVEVPNGWSDMKYPQSVGLFYTAATEAAGFKPNEHEYKLMAWATHLRVLDKVSYPKKDSYTELVFNRDKKLRQLDLLRDVTKLNWHRGFTSAVKGTKNYTRWVDLVPFSEGDTLKTARAGAIAVQAQTTYEDWLFDTLRTLIVTSQHPPKKILLTGGCALNCSANHVVEERLKAEGLWVGIEAFSNAGDAGSVIGAGCAVAQNPLLRAYDPLIGALPTEAFKRATKLFADKVNRITYRLLGDHKIVGVHMGPGEFGPRALGNRSILAHPDVDKKLLDDLKQREVWQPFGIVILREAVADYFDGITFHHAPYMNTVVKWKDPANMREMYPAAVHTDGTARIQTVDNPKRLEVGLGWTGNPTMYYVLKAMVNAGYPPFLINTSLNEKGKPMPLSLTRVPEMFNGKIPIVYYP